MEVTEKAGGEFNETDDGCGGCWRCGGGPKSIAPLAEIWPLFTALTAAAVAMLDVAGWKESALKGTPKLAAAAQAAAAAAAAEVGSIFSLTMASSCFFNALLSLARRFWNQILTWKIKKKSLSFFEEICCIWFVIHIWSVISSFLNL